MHILRAADYTRMPWKNGGGETREIAVFPAGSTITDFGWRISMALVASDGPFSIFSRIDRTLTILEGGPMELTLQGRSPRRLDRQSPPLSFPADIAAMARLTGSPVTDLNVMTRRGVFSHTVRLVSIQGEAQALETGTPCAIFCMEGSVHIRTEHARADLESHDCCLAGTEDGVALISGAGKAAIISIHSF